jgi:hypothetical protein
MLEQHAGSCLPIGSRHIWGKEEPWRGMKNMGLMRYNQQRCKQCRRVRVIIYTKWGNHIHGYECAEGHEVPA